MEKTKKDGIGIIIPSYKPKNYIEKCLESLELQTFDKKNFKVYIILNGEKEVYFNYLKKVTKKFTFNLELIHIAKKGVSYARNLGIALNEYKYILFIDDDDFISKNFLKDIYIYRQENGIVFSNTISLNSEKGFELDYLGVDFLKNYKKDNISLLNSRKQLSNSCGKLISSKIILNIRYKENLSIGEDSLFMAMLSKNIRSIIYSSKEIIYYRNIRNDSCSRTKITFKKIKNDVYLIAYYLILLLKRYNKIFILSRILGTIKRNLILIKGEK